LANLYSDESVFSLSINPYPSDKSSISRSDRNFDAWWHDNRNLDRVRQPDKRQKMLKIGSQNIIGAFLNLPATSHPIGDHKKFIIDSLSLQSSTGVQLMVTIHGELTEGTHHIQRSFDRTFIIIPSHPNSKAAASGIPYTLLNDQLVVRCFSSNFEWENANPQLTALPNVFFSK
jgi:nuclear RNA export factor